MKTRREKFLSYATHGWLKRVYARLSVEDEMLALDFIRNSDALDKGSFELAVNRMFLDRTKPKNYALILELLTCCNSAVDG